MGGDAISPNLPFNRLQRGHPQYMGGDVPNYAKVNPLLKFLLIYPKLNG